jgi:hypothetical protein
MSPNHGEELRRCKQDGYETRNANKNLLIELDDFTREVIS